MPRLAHLLFLWLVITAPAAWASEPSVPPQTPPQALNVVLTPQPDADGGVARLNVEMRLPAPAVSAGEALLRMPVTLVSTPTAAYAADAITVRDDLGVVSLSARDDPPTSEGVYRRYLAQRAPVGDLVVSYSVTPRAVSAETRNGPLFDLRAQPGGLMGAGVYFFALPVGEAVYDITLDWDLSALPDGARGVWSLGEGPRSVTAPASLLSFAFYAVGAISSEPAAGADDFALYWLAQPPFDIAELAEETRSLYDYMARFFGDADAPYRVFIRENPYPAGGGTALAKSFMFGYGANGQTTDGGLQMLLAHEMAHNWPRLTDDAHPLTAWYSEGAAEYYASTLAYRAGVLSTDDLLDIVNRRADGYYANPHLTLSNAEAGQIFWSDSRAQRVPYGRGFMYLTNVDAQVRAASGGARSLDDLVLEMLARQHRGEPAGLAEWKSLIIAELGDEAGREFEAMTQGEVVIPRPDTLGPCFRTVAAQTRPFDLGFDEMRLGVVADLRPDSAAARAGLMDGDEIVSITPIRDIQADETMLMQMTIRRDGQTQDVSYLPRGGAISSWRWEKAEGAPAGACVL